MEVKKVFAIDEDFANAVLQYLVTKPFAEVHHFVQGFQSLRTVEMYKNHTPIPFDLLKGREPEQEG
jgi:hypothetical protein